ncbi:MAG: Ig-like domain-containing protein, partial [Gemmatimonadetes bacterium]|nr:Ig-like domain-containing protein [Gemmatimonadota bacterium]
MAKVLVFPSSATIDNGNDRQYTTLALNAAGRLSTTPPPIAWTSSNTAVATVGATGVVKGLGGGTATVKATIGGLAGRVQVYVTAPLQYRPPAGPRRTRPGGSNVRGPAMGRAPGSRSPAVPRYAPEAAQAPLARPRARIPVCFKHLTRPALFSGL